MIVLRVHAEKCRGTDYLNGSTVLKLTHEITASDFIPVCLAVNALILCSVPEISWSEIATSEGGSVKTFKALAS